jgi:DNA-binding NarL/FixJ family response regulator
MYDESLYAERALTAGARGYIMKQEAVASVVKAIRKILAGEVCASELFSFG